MGKLNKKILYAAYIICTGLFFLYYLFPSETVKAFLLSKIVQAAPDFSVTIEDLRPSFPLGVNLLNISVNHKGNPVLDAEKLSVSPGFFSLFAGRMAVDVYCDAYEGQIDATVDFNGRGVLVRAADIELNHIQIGDIFFLKDRIPHNLRGFLDGRVNYAVGENNISAVTSDVTLNDFQIEFTSPFHGLDKLSLNRIKANFNSDRSQVTVKRFVSAGGDVDGSLSGTILIRRRIEKSVLNLNGSVRPNPEFVDKLGKMGPIVKSLIKKSRGGDFPVKLQGTFERPRFF